MQAHRQPRLMRRLATFFALCALATACAQLAPRPAASAAATADGQPHPDAESYTLDPVHTRVAIAIDHAGFSRAIGTVSGTTGTLWLVPGSWEGARVQAEIPVSALDFGNEAWNSAVAARGLLDSERHPLATFSSTRVEALGEGRARIHGRLTLRGITREVVLEATRNGERRYPLPPFRHTVGFSATTTLSRSDFGSTAWDSLIGDAVEVRIELEAAR